MITLVGWKFVFVDMGFSDILPTFDKTTVILQLSLY